MCKYEYLLINASKEKLWRQSSTAVLLAALGARGHITLMLLHPPLHYCYYPAREEECSICCYEKPCLRYGLFYLHYCYYINLA